ncbi:hypothetical protein [Aeropyrum camini]|uniref:hypothetical protein n=1 Tax=Aeropyrum camini TaxID=229980 RepID=UPI000786971D|nr:hypothetical protein [Aeropyrum camini]
MKVEEISMPGSPLYVDLSGDTPIIERIRIPRRPQYKIDVDVVDVASVYNAVSMSLKKVLAGSGGAREVKLKPLIHVVIKTDKPVNKARFIAEVRRAAGKADVLLKIHWKVAGGGEYGGASLELRGEGPLDLAKIAAEHYSIPLEAASTILHELAEAAAEKDEERVKEILQALATSVDQDVWRRVLNMR